MRVICKDEDDIEWLDLKSDQRDQQRMRSWPESSSGSFWLDGHVAGATETGGTAGSGEGRRVAHVTVGRSGRHVVAATPLFCVHLRTEAERGGGRELG